VTELTAYEARQVAEIAAWKGEAPGPVWRALKKVREPLGRVVGKVVPGAMVGKLAEKAEALVERRDGADRIARSAGVGNVSELKHRSLEECDRLARSVSARAQRQAILESVAAGAGGIATEILNIPVLLAAAERAILRVGHCYGYRLDTEADRRYVLALLELASDDDLERRPRHIDRLRRLEREGTRGSAPGSARGFGVNGAGKQVAEELALEAVPVLGEAVSVALDYAFMRRVDVAARRAFQERWLRDRGKVDEIPPSPPGDRRRALQSARALLTEATYLGGYGVGFALTVPVAAAGLLAARLPRPIVRGAVDGARDAAVSADDFREGWRSLAEPTPGPTPRPAGLTA
jgi:hypothetical protein